MSIRGNDDSPVTCDTCGGSAFQREVVVVHPPHSHQVVYQTHYWLNDTEHQAVHDRIEAFYEKLHSIQDDLFKLLPIELEYGSIIKIDLSGIKPTACDTRTKFIPIATIRVFGQIRDIKADDMGLDSDTTAIISSIKEATDPVVQSLKKLRDRGDI